MLITQMLEQRLSALLQLHLHSRLNTLLHWIRERQLQDETRNIYVLEFGAPDISGLTSCMLIYNTFIINETCVKLKQTYNCLGYSRIANTVVPCCTESISGSIKSIYPFIFFQP